MVNTKYTRLPVCPECGHVDKNWWDRHIGGAESYEDRCDRCDTPRTVLLHRSITFSTVVRKDAEAES